MDDSEKYFFALGKFIDAFSKTEAAVQLVLWQVCDIETEVAKSIFSGTRTNNAISYIRRVSEAQKKEIPQDIQDAFAHLSAINTSRDTIVHYGSIEREDGARIVSNSYIAHTDKSLREFIISDTTLFEMSSDLATIMVRLIAHYYGRGPDLTDDEWSESLRVSRAPFRYKPPQPKNTRPQTQHKKDKSQPQKKSSHQKH